VEGERRGINFFGGGMAGRKMSPERVWAFKIRGENDVEGVSERG
jgi:hypothetical protein